MTIKRVQFREKVPLSEVKRGPKATLLVSDKEVRSIQGATWRGSPGIAVRPVQGTDVVWLPTTVLAAVVFDDGTELVFDEAGKTEPAPKPTRKRKAPKTT